MSNLTRYDPFPLDPVSDLFQGFFRPLRGMVSTDEADLAAVKIDVTENNEGYTVKAELPGVDKNDIDVQIDGNLVSINAKVERNKELKEGDRVVRRERYAGSFSSSFKLGSSIDESKATAQYRDGVLSLTLPKLKRAESKRLPVN